jgi:hypothetical protein
MKTAISSRVDGMAVVWKKNGLPEKTVDPTAT